MSKSAVDRIRAMQEKGTLTAEQAEELLKALGEEQEGAAHPEGDAAAGAAASAPEPNPEPGDKAGAGTAAGADPFESYGRKGRGRRTFLDMEWVDDMVDGITSGLGVSAGSRSWDDDRSRRDSRRAARRGGNAQSSSRVDQPEGEDFEFQGNRVVFSKILRPAPGALQGQGQLFLRIGSPWCRAHRQHHEGHLLRGLLPARAAHGGGGDEGRHHGRLEAEPPGEGRGALMKNARISGSPITALALKGRARSRTADSRVPPSTG